MKMIFAAIRMATVWAAGLALVAMVVGDHDLADRFRHRTGTAGGRFSSPKSQSTKSQPFTSGLFVFGEGGIRTRGGILRSLTGLANRRYRPLSHLSKLPYC